MNLFNKEHYFKQINCNLLAKYTERLKSKISKHSQIKVMLLNEILHMRKFNSEHENIN